jgi:CRP-like cAMP-binding protein
MLPIDSRIHRAQRLVRMLEEDAPLLAIRVAELTPERQQSAQEYAAQLAATARAELDRLLQYEYTWDSNDPTPEAAD